MQPIYEKGRDLDFEISSTTETQKIVTGSTPDPQPHGSA